MNSPTVRLRITYELEGVRGSVDTSVTSSHHAAMQEEPGWLNEYAARVVGRREHVYERMVSILSVVAQ